jgi:hypothetical protein
VKSFFGFETTVEKIAVKQYAHNLEKVTFVFVKFNFIIIILQGKEIMLFFIEQVEREGGKTVQSKWVDSDESQQHLTSTNHNNNSNQEQQHTINTDKDNENVPPSPADSAIDVAPVRYECVRMRARVLQ